MGTVSPGVVTVKPSLPGSVPRPISFVTQEARGSQAAPFAWLVHRGTAVLTASRVAAAVGRLLCQHVQPMRCSAVGRRLLSGPVSMRREGRISRTTTGEKGYGDARASAEGREDKRRGDVRTNSEGTRGQTPRDVRANTEGPCSADYLDTPQSALIRRPSAGGRYSAQGGLWPAGAPPGMLGT